MDGKGREEEGAVSQTPVAGSRRVSRVPASAPTRTLEKGLFLLGLFDEEKPEWTLRELRERAGLPKPTTRRLVKTLEASGWVTYESATGKYRLGSSVLRAVYLATSHSELVRIAHPYLVELAEETTESCSLSIWTDQGPMIIDTVPTSRLFRPNTYVGMLLQGISSADAQVLIAFGPEENWDAILAKPVVPRTHGTVTDSARLRERWREVRRRGVAFDNLEWNPEAPAVAAPVFDRSGQLRAAIHVVPPVERSSDADMQRHAEAVKKTAAKVSREL
jgi:DNA-binding IclR family transcriptional regulator